MKSIWIGVASPIVLVTALAGEIPFAPPSFQSSTKKIIPIDFESETAELVLDVPRRKAAVHAEVVFVASEKGYPLLDLVPPAEKVLLDGVALTDGLPLVTSPGNYRMRMVDQEVTPGRHTLVVEYSLASEVTFTTGGARIGFFMNDIGDERQFLEQYLPANYEFDQFALELYVAVQGAQRAHQIHTNGTLVPLDESEWLVVFPSYFNSSSPFFHLTDRNLPGLRYDYSLASGRKIPVDIYAESTALLREGNALISPTLKELESTYGEFAHRRLTVYITSGDSGMEYVGATMTAVGALTHELTHSWFARGVMPTNGNSGWIDEAIASWRDNRYPRANRAPSRAAVNLAAFSPYRRVTTTDAYDEGAQLISELDYLFRSQGNGMRGILKDFFSTYKRQTVDSEVFKKFMEKKTGVALGNLFDRYVYGKSSATERERIGDTTPKLVSLHPRPYTHDEAARHR